MPTVIKKARTASHQVKPLKAAPASKAKPKKGGDLVVLQSDKKHSRLAVRKEAAKNFIDSLKENSQGVFQTETLQSFLKKGYVSEQDIAAAFAEKYSFECISNLKDYKINKDVTALVPFHLCQKYTLIPLARIHKTLVVVFADPSDMHIRDNLALITKHRVQPAVAPVSDIKAAVDRHYDNKSEWNSLFYEVDKISNADSDDLDADRSVVDLETALTVKSEKEEMAVVHLVNLIFSEGIRLNASDIHMEIYEKAFRIRYRVDGALFEKHNLPKNVSAALISRIKVISNMDISEKRRPQDARLKVRVSGRELNIRLNTTPTVNGEKLVMRILNDSALQTDMSKLGMEKEQLEMFKTALNQPQGLILMTGPTGSGKTTTIYSGLETLNTPERNISTVEDPVEFRIHGINQVQVNPKADLSFASALRAFLRQDPDVILVGEIRDAETSETAYKAAATGHLVLSTLHTNDTAGTVARLLSMGVPAYNVADNTSLIVSQRLVRKICRSCAEPARGLSDSLLMKIGVLKEELPSFKGKIYEKGAGCPDCNEIGYNGRAAVYEMMRITSSVKEAVFKNSAAAEIKALAIGDGMNTLRQSALNKLKEGVTSIEEVVRSTVLDRYA